MRFTETLQKASNQPRELETDTEREREKRGSRNLLLQFAVCLKKQKKNCCPQCLFVGKISLHLQFFCPGFHVCLNEDSFLFQLFTVML